MVGRCVCLSLEAVLLPFDTHNRYEPIGHNKHGTYLPYVRRGFLPAKTNSPPYPWEAKNKNHPLTHTKKNEKNARSHPAPTLSPDRRRGSNRCIPAPRMKSRTKALPFSTACWGPFVPPTSRSGVRLLPVNSHLPFEEEALPPPPLPPQPSPPPPPVPPPPLLPLLDAETGVLGPAVPFEKPLPLDPPRGVDLVDLEAGVPPLPPLWLLYSLKLCTQQKKTKKTKQKQEQKTTTKNNNNNNNKNNNSKLGRLKRAYDVMFALLYYRTVAICNILLLWVSCQCKNRLVFILVSKRSFYFRPGWYAVSCTKAPLEKGTKAAKLYLRARAMGTLELTVPN